METVLAVYHHLRVYWELGLRIREKVGKGCSATPLLEAGAVQAKVLRDAVVGTAELTRYPKGIDQAAEEAGRYHMNTSRTLVLDCWGGFGKDRLNLSCLEMDMELAQMAAFG